MARTRRKTLAQQPIQAAPANRIFKTAGYARLSVLDSGKPGADTIEGQKTLIEKYVESRSDMELCALYCDNGQTGTDFERPEFEKLMNAVRRGEIDCIVVKDLSRFGRNYKETGNYIERIFPFLEVRFVAINDSFDTLTAERTQDGYTVPLKNLINEVYSRDISRKSGSVLEAKQKNGEFIGAWAPYGYSKDPDNKNRLVINEELAPIVRQIFTWRAEGVSVMQIARRLNDEGILSPSAYLYETGVVKSEKYHGVPWRIQVLKTLLSHPVYIGHMIQGRKKQSFYEGKRQTHTPESEWKTVRNTHEAIIDEATFERVQEIVEQRHDEYNAKLGKYDHLECSENLLRGLVYCPNCERPMVRYKNVSHGKKLWYTYICPTHAVDPSRCPFVSIREEELFEAVFAAVKSQIELAADMERLTRAKNASPAIVHGHSDTLAKLDAARRTLKRSQSLYDSLYQSYVERLMTEQEYVTLKASYRAKAEEAERLIAALEREQRTAKELTPENLYLTEFQAFGSIPLLSREMACALIERIYVDENKSIDIRFRYRDEFKALLDYVEGRAAV